MTLEAGSSEFFLTSPSLTRRVGFEFLPFLTLIQKPPAHFLLGNVYVLIHC